ASSHVPDTDMAHGEQESYWHRPGLRSSQRYLKFNRKGRNGREGISKGVSRELPAALLLKLPTYQIIQLPNLFDNLNHTVANTGKHSVGPAHHVQGGWPCTLLRGCGHRSRSQERGRIRSRAAIAA